MATRHDLDTWVVEALNSLGGKGVIPVVCKYIWDNYEKELRMSGNLFYTWQYDIRWSVVRLRKQGLLVGANVSGNGLWELDS